MLTKEETLKILALHKDTDTQIHLISKYKFSSEDLDLIVKDVIKNNPLIQSSFHKY